MQYKLDICKSIQHTIFCPVNKPPPPSQTVPSRKDITIKTQGPRTSLCKPMKLIRLISFQNILHLVGL